MKWFQSRSFKMLLFIPFGMVFTEASFHVRDGGAFPHVNFYLNDSQLGVRLRPEARQKIRFNDNPVSSIRINDQGYRGKAWPAATSDEIIVVGDSQVFGLGVEEEETFSAQLSERTGRQVINAGVPTYGPLEYSHVAKELIASRKPQTLIYTINFVNDLFETERPNHERHAVWDGWAVRIETAPKEIISFPGRHWLFSQSHFVFALRRFLHSQENLQFGREGLPSEGGWEDVVQQEQKLLSAKEAHRQSMENRKEELNELNVRMAKHQEELNLLLRQSFSMFEFFGQDADILLEAASGYPGDILRDNNAEEGRNVLVTAELIREGVAFREKVLAEKKEEENEKATAIRAGLDKRKELRTQRNEIRRQVPSLSHPRSVLGPRIQEMVAFCKENGVELVVLALPMDIQVSPKEWEKYGVSDPPDMSSTLLLVSDLVSISERMGAKGVDTTQSLLDVEPGAFLYGDIHMTPKGHGAVASELAEKLSAPFPVAQPLPGLPEGRTWVPRPDDWIRTPENHVRGSTRANCQTVQIEEWLRISCFPNESNEPTGAKVLQGDHGEAMVMSTKHATTLITPLFPGEVFEADFFWSKRSQKLTATWEKEGEKLVPQIEFSSVTKPGQPLEVSDMAHRLCQCHMEEVGEKSCLDVGWDYMCSPACGQLVGDLSVECFDSYADDCGLLLQCTQHSEGVFPSCESGSVNAGGTGKCFALCDQNNPCSEGDCHPWQGTGICW